MNLNIFTRKGTKTLPQYGSVPMGEEYNTGFHTTKIKQDLIPTFISTPIKHRRSNLGHGDIQSRTIAFKHFWVSILKNTEVCSLLMMAYLIVGFEAEGSW